MSDLGVSSAYFGSRPSILVDGEPVHGLAEGLLSLMIEETTEGLFRLEACFGNWGSSASGVGFLFFDRANLDFGKTMTIQMGEGGNRAPVFEGRIMALEACFPQTRPPELRVLAEDRCQDLRMTRRSRTFEEVNDEDIIRQIAGEHGLRAEVDIDGPDYQTVAQVNQSDLAFLRERTRSIDAELWVEGDALFAQARARRRAAAQVTLTYGQGLRELEICADLASQRSSMTVAGWDVEAKEAIVELADESAIQPELNGGDSGASVLAGALGARHEQIVHDVPLASSEALAIAEAEYRKVARRFVRGVGVAEGDARIKVATKVTLAGLGPMFNGAYYVCRACHRFDGQGGYQTHLEVERPGLGRGT